MAVKRGQIIMTLGIILMLVGMVFYLFIFDFLTAGEAVWTMDELESSFFFSPKVQINDTGDDEVVWSECITDFNGLDPGDTVFIKDKVYAFLYNDTLGKTVVWFKSSGIGMAKIKDPSHLHRDVIWALEDEDDGHHPYLFFDGDITGDLTAGQMIAIELTIGGVKGKSEFIEALGKPLDEKSKGLSTDDIIDIETFQIMGLVLIIAAAALIGVGAFFNFKLDVEKRPEAAGEAGAAPRKEVAGGAPTRQTKCPACGAGIPITPGATSIKCGSCGRSYQIGAGATGAAPRGPPAPAAAQAARQTKCPGCGTMISVTPGASTIRCHGCGRSYNVGGGAQRTAAPPAATAGPPAAAPRPAAGAPQPGARQSRCPGCGGNIVIPAGSKNVTCPTCKQSFRVG